MIYYDYLDIGIFPKIVHLFLYDNKGARSINKDKNIKRFNIQFEEEDLLESSGMLKTVSVQALNKSNVSKDILVAINIECGVMFGTIVHESVHAAMRILNIVGVKVDVDNDEILAYFTEYISDFMWRKYNQILSLK